MRKKVHYTLFTIALLTVFTPLVKAEGSCSSTVLYDERMNASEVSVGFDPIEEIVYDETNDPSSWTEYYLQIKVNNIPDNVKIEVKSLDKTFADFDLDLSDKDADNNVVFPDTSIKTIKRMQFNVISTTDECNGSILKTLTLNTPMFNELVNAPVCAQYPDFKYCTAFTNFDVSSLSTTDFNKELDVYINDANKKEEKESVVKTVAKTVKKHWGVVLVIVVVVVLGGLVAFIVIKKKRSSVI